PRRLRVEWRQEWEAELQYRERLLAEWDQLNWRTKLDLLWHSAGAFVDALWLQPKRWEDEIFQDIRYGIRMMRKAPGFTAIAVLALALGIGVNTAILSTVNAFVLRPLPVEKPAELVAPYWGRNKDTQVWGQFSWQNYVDLREQNKTFSDLCAWAQTSAGISSGEHGTAGESVRAEVAWGELVSSNYFDVMGVRPMLGRGFLPEEDRTPNAHPVVVISHPLWQRRFNADAGLLGQTIYLNGLPFTVIGVMPESFIGSRYYLRQAFWAPSMMAQKFGRRAEWQTDRSYASFRLYGRLKPGVTMAQAETDLNRVVGALAQLYPRENADSKIQLTTELDGRWWDSTRMIKYGGLLALCVSGLVLLLACANVANLMLARARTRAREIGIRLALGAGRARIVRQLLTESVLLAGCGGVLGWALAYRGVDVIRATIPPGPCPVNYDHLAPDGYVLKWMLAVSLLTGVIFGLAPALLAARADLVAVIKGGAARQSHSNQRWRRWNLRGALVVAQVTISIIVLICAGIFIRSLGQAYRTDPGFQTDNLVTLMINLDLLAYDQDATRRFYPELQRRLEAQPGVRAAALASDMPLTADRSVRGPIVREGEPDSPPNQGVISECSFVTPKYFDTLRTPLLLGRDFTDRDNAAAPRVVIVNQEFARRFYGNEQKALGRRFRFAQGTPLMEIIGVAKDGFYRNLYESRQLYMFLPVSQHPRARMTLLVSAQSAEALRGVVESARQAIAQLDARLPVLGELMAEENLSLAYWPPRMAAGMATTFGVLALLLATLGLYSVMTYAVSQRTREIGIRMALGAQVRDVLRLVVSQGMRMVLIGVALGLAVAFALTRVLASLLLGVGTTDSVTFVGVAVLLVAVALLACYLPARRAARVDPLMALRDE
ncbi:MAG TPA: ABC transporter permease, partial [Blastocatellia bacterium]|nr:ABC transporter permease [Blastocatellia bacterium]